MIASSVKTLLCSLIMILSGTLGATTQVVSLSPKITHEVRDFLDDDTFLVPKTGRALERQKEEETPLDSNLTFIAKGEGDD